MARLAWSEVRLHPVRYAATLAATAIGVGFVVALLVFVPTQFRGIGARATASTAVADVVVSGVDDRAGTFAARFAAQPGVAAVDRRLEVQAELSAHGHPGSIRLLSLPSDPRLNWLHLSSGRWPAAGELVVSGATAAAYDLRVGDPVEVGLGGSGSSSQRRLTVSGITDEGRSLFEGLQPAGLVPVATFPAESARYPTFLVLAEPGVDPGLLRDRLAGLVPADAAVQTSADLGRQAVDQLSGGAQAAQLLLLTFGAIALLVGAMIVTNTQLLVVAQRRRQIALLRVVGADRRQVRRSLLAETALVGALGSVGGDALGVALAVLVSAGLQSLGGGVVVPLGQIAIAVAVGVVVGLAASLAPTWRATRIAPIEALRPVADAAVERRTGRLRIVVGATLVLLGAGGIVAGGLVPPAAFLMAVAGSFGLAVGILALAPLYVPPLLRVAGRLVGRAGPTARLAAANLAHHPRRTAATATALMLAVGLIVTLQVGAASVKVSVRDEVARQFPVDVSVLSAGVPISPTVRAAVAAVPGVRAVEPVVMTDARAVAGSHAASAAPEGAGAEIGVVGLAPSAARVVGGGFEDVRPGVALVHPFTLEMLSAKAGDPVRLDVGRRSVVLRLAASDLADAGQVVVPASTLARLAPAADVRLLWVRTDQDRPAQILAGINAASSAQLGLQVGGSLVQSAAVASAVDAVLLVATALLGVAVLIALVGVGNTISLSVIERARESALLRALGVQRRQLRGMLAVEAALLAVVATLVGVVCGIGFGVIGTHSLGTQLGLARVHYTVSVPQTALVVAVALLAGLVASVLPGRRAAAADPARLLADD